LSGNLSFRSAVRNYVYTNPLDILVQSDYVVVAAKLRIRRKCREIVAAVLYEETTGKEDRFKVPTAAT
jgi:hypothetical protein